MTITHDSVIRNDFRESIVSQNSQNTTKVKAEERPIEEVLTLSEIKLHLDDILKETQIKYTIDDSNDSFIIKVMDKKTDKLIKEIPSHDIQVLRKHFRAHMGVLFNELI